MNTLTLTSLAYDGRYMELSCAQVMDIATNKSAVNWTLSAIGGNSNNYSTGPTTVMINGVQVYYCPRVEWDARKFPAAKGSVSGTAYVDHKPDGSKSIEVSMSTVVFGGTVRTYTETWTLDTIPRGATLLTSSDFNDTQLPTVTYSNPAGNSVESLEICIADSAGMNGYVPYRAINKTGTLSYTFTADDVTALKNITGNTLKLKFVIRTKIGGAYYYSGQDGTFTVTENETTKPKVSMEVVLNNGSLPGQFAGVYIQGKSKVNVSLSAEGQYNATIQSYSAQIDGKKYSSQAFTSDAIQSSGSVDILGYAKDSRGFTGYVSQQITVVEYSKPLAIPLASENAILCYRSDGNGSRVGNSTSVWVKAKRSYYSLSGKNACALQWRRKKVTEVWDDSVHTWSDLLTGSNTATDEYSALLSGVVFDLKESYTIQIRAIDSIGEADTKTFEVPTQDVALHLGRGGKNVAVGTYCDYSTPYTFYSDWLGIFDKGILGSSQNHNATDVLTFAEECVDGLTPIIINELTNKATLPEGNYGYSVGIVHKRAADQFNVILMDYVTGKIAINVHLSGTWTGWKYITPQ